MCNRTNCPTKPRKGRLCAECRRERERDRKLMAKDGLTPAEVADNLKIIYGE